MLALHLGGAKKAEPYVKKLDPYTKNRILVNHFAATGKWDSVLKVYDKAAEFDLDKSTTQQRLLLYQWLGERERFDGLIKGLTDKLPKDDPESVRTLIGFHINNLDLKSASEHYSADYQVDIFQMLCYLNRYDEAFEFLEIGKTEEEQKAWYRKQTADLQGMNHELQQRFNRDTYYAIERKFRLLLNLAYYVGSLGNQKQSREFFNLLADAEIDDDYRSMGRRSETVRMILQLEDFDFCHQFLEQRYSDRNLQTAISHRFTPTGDMVIARFWYDTLKEEIPNEFDRIRAIGEFLHPGLKFGNEAHERFLRLGENAILRETDLRERALKLAYVAETFLQRGEIDRSNRLYWEAVECGKSDSLKQLGFHYFDRQQWREAKRLLQMHFDLSGDERDLFLVAICHSQLNDQEQYQRDKLKATGFLAANYLERGFLQELKMLRQHEEIIEYVQLRLASKLHLTNTEFLDEAMITSLGEIAPEKTARHPQVLLFKIAGRDKPSMNRLTNVEYARQAEMSRLREFLSSGDIDAAWSSAEKLSNFNPGDSQLAEDFVPLFEKAGRKDLADRLFTRIAKHYQKLLALYPESALHHNNYAWICAKCSRNVDESLQHALDATRLRPGNSSYLDTLAEIYFLQGKKKEAIELAEKCIQIDPTKIHYRRQLERFQK